MNTYKHRPYFTIPNQSEGTWIYLVLLHYFTNKYIPQGHGLTMAGLIQSIH